MILARQDVPTLWCNNDITAMSLPMAGKVISPRLKAIVGILLSVHAVKFPSKYLSLGTKT